MLQSSPTGPLGIQTTQVSTCDAKSICTIKLQGLCWRAWIGQTLTLTAVGGLQTRNFDFMITTMKVQRRVDIPEG